MTRPVGPPRRHQARYRGRPDWRAVYEGEVSDSERALGKLADAVFAVWSFLARMIVYAALRVAGASGHALFLNAISIEAVAVTLCVGINTKLQLKGDRIAQEQRDWMQDEVERAVLSDKEMTQALHEFVRELLDRMP